MKEIMDKHFSVIEDKRSVCDVEHRLTDILIIVMCGVLCGIDTIKEIHSYAQNKLEMLRQKFGIEKVPSEPTMSRVLSMTDGEEVGTAIISIMMELLGVKGDIVAIDGKTIRSTKKMQKISKSLQILTAYATENGVTLGQLSIDRKTNEIPVLRELLEIIDVKGKIVTADAMHCQKDTCKKIIEKGGNYVIGVKENQKYLYDTLAGGLEAGINDETKIEAAQIIEKSRDRYEDRNCYKILDLEQIHNKADWVGLRCAFAVQRITITDSKITDETNFYISSIDAAPERLLEIVRSHWKIESMHWQLDVVFSEDECRLQSIDGQKNLNIFRKLALAIHKNFLSSQKKKDSVKNNMFNCLLNDNKLFDVLSSPCNNQ